ncbi:hypothetical protein HOK51_08865 [Candidatus Woesearchaeota archaeon]|jgi:hypothetical protein|nr:hypothetical protein [Candidatus Woesearchaeota archaeon]MBT6519939.1 hypothetical protein [Candidatus Woesearchaeota archaeon]MBT7367860.1 hypothetical protein [Candidatus Woesearchaeota archaeon]
MVLLSTFKNEQIKKWIESSKSAKKAVKNFKKYLDRHIEKIETFQDLSLKIGDFYNKHFFEKDDARLLRKGYGHTNSIRLYKKYFHLVKKRLKRIKKLIEQEYRDEEEEQEELYFIHYRLVNLIITDKKIKNSISDIEEFKSKFESIEKYLSRQLDLVNKILSKFKRFVGNKELWDTDYSCNRRNYKSVELYSNVLENKEQIFKEWDEFLVDIQKLKHFIREESMILINRHINRDISDLRSQVLKYFSEVELFSDLQNIIEYTSAVKKLADGPIIVLYHATENRRMSFPLLESKYPGGFFVCTKKEYAFKIKLDQSIDYNIHNSLNVVSFKMPDKLFKSLFLQDDKSGRDGDNESIEAYENAYFIPLSRFPLFNTYVRLGLIEKL